MAEPRTLLIVDDEELFTRSLADGISTLEPSLRVLTAANGRLALDVLGREHVDLVLSDLKMPVVGGFELLSAVSRDHQDVPVIVLTAFETPEISDRLREMGALEVIEKPVDFGRLAEKITAVLDTGATASPAPGLLTGSLGVFSPFELLQVLSDLRKTGAVTIARNDGASARCAFHQGGLGDSECGHRRGREAVLTFLWWKKGTFVFDARGGGPDPGPALRVPEVLMDAVRLADEIERQADSLPPRDVPLFLEESSAPPDDTVGCSVSVVHEALRAEPGLTGAELESRLPLAPVKVRLSLALLAATGCLLQPRRGHVEPRETTAEPGSEFWLALRRRHPGGLRVLVAACDDPPGRLYRAVSRLGEALGLDSPPVSFSPNGPSFVRLRPPSGGILSLTFLPVARKHRYLFETFVRSVQVVLLCRESARSSGDGMSWADAVPPDVTLIPLESSAAAEEDIARELRSLVTGPEPGSSPSPIERERRA